jgi:recombinational DNA repair ATPase RecF
MYRFRQFKSFAEAELDLRDAREGPGSFTLLIGRNGAGKTNAIEAIELLAEIARGRRLQEIGDIGRAPHGFEVRGGLRGCVRTGADALP